MTQVVRASGEAATRAQGAAPETAAAGHSAGLGLSAAPSKGREAQ